MKWVTKRPNPLQCSFVLNVTVLHVMNLVETQCVHYIIYLLLWAQDVYRGKSILLRCSGIAIGTWSAKTRDIYSSELWNYAVEGMTTTRLNRCMRCLCCCLAMRVSCCAFSYTSLVFGRSSARIPNLCSLRRRTVLSSAWPMRGTSRSCSSVTSWTVASSASSSRRLRMRYTTSLRLLGCSSPATLSCTSSLAWSSAAHATSANTYVGPTQHKSPPRKRPATCASITTHSGARAASARNAKAMYCLLSPALLLSYHGQLKHKRKISIRCNTTNKDQAHAQCSTTFPHRAIIDPVPSSVDGCFGPSHGVRASPTPPSVDSTCRGHRNRRLCELEQQVMEQSQRDNLVWALGDHHGGIKCHRQDGHQKHVRQREPPRRALPCLASRLSQQSRLLQTPNDKTHRFKSVGQCRMDNPVGVVHNTTS
eukprot:m.928410 g.928410  ORF g.928410 m.928410 type:complete len:422 (-) comp23775_c0_seq45:4653-5918(-)